MAPCRLWKKPTGGLVLLAAALVVAGLAVLGGAAPQQGRQLAGDGGVVIPPDVRRSCLVSGDIALFEDLLSCASLDEKNTPRCCHNLRALAPDADDCICGVLKVIKGTGIDINSVCKATGLEKACKAKAEAARQAQEKKAEAERAAQQREDMLRKLDPCDRFFERMADRDLSKVDPKDARACIQTIKTCPASCKKQQ